MSNNRTRSNSRTVDVTVGTQTPQSVHKIQSNKKFSNTIDTNSYGKAIRSPRSTQEESVFVFQSPQRTNNTLSEKKISPLRHPQSYLSQVFFGNTSKDTKSSTPINESFYSTRRSIYESTPISLLSPKGRASSSIRDAGVYVTDACSSHTTPNISKKNHLVQIPEQDILFNQNSSRKRLKPVNNTKTIGSNRSRSPVPKEITNVLKRSKSPRSPSLNSSSRTPRSPSLNGRSKSPRSPSSNRRSKSPHSATLLNTRSKSPDPQPNQELLDTNLPVLNKNSLWKKLFNIQLKDKGNKYILYLNSIAKGTRYKKMQLCSISIMLGLFLLLLWYTPLIIRDLQKSAHSNTNNILPYDPIRIGSNINWYTVEKTNEIQNATIEKQEQEIEIERNQRINAMKEFGDLQNEHDVHVLSLEELQEKIGVALESLRQDIDIKHKDMYNNIMNDMRERLKTIHGEIFGIGGIEGSGTSAFVTNQSTRVNEILRSSLLRENKVVINTIFQEQQNEIKDNWKDENIKKYDNLMNTILNKYNLSITDTFNNITKRFDNLEKYTIKYQDFNDILQRIDKLEKYTTVNQYNSNNNKNKLVSNNINNNAITLIDLQRELEKFAADRINRIDYALGSNGGIVLSSSSTYIPTNTNIGLFSQLRLRTNIHHNRPQVVLEQNMDIGQCWPMEGSNGHIVIKLSTKIIIDSFSIQHISPNISKNISTAPRIVELYGLRANTSDVNDKIGQASSTDEILLGKGEYLLDSNHTVQTFTIQNTQPYTHVRFVILSNHGDQFYTCIYRQRVHGTPYHDNSS